MRSPVAKQRHERRIPLHGSRPPSSRSTSPGSADGQPDSRALPNRLSAEPRWSPLILMAKAYRAKRLAHPYTARCSGPSPLEHVKPPAAARAVVSVDPAEARDRRTWHPQPLQPRETVPQAPKTRAHQEVAAAVSTVCLSRCKITLLSRGQSHLSSRGGQASLASRGAPRIQREKLVSSQTMWDSPERGRADANQSTRAAPTRDQAVSRLSLM